MNEKLLNLFVSSFAVLKRNPLLSGTLAVSHCPHPERPTTYLFHVRELVCFDCYLKTLKPPQTFHGRFSRFFQFGECCDSPDKDDPWVLIMSADRWFSIHHTCLEKLFSDVSYDSLRILIELNAHGRD